MNKILKTFSIGLIATLSATVLTCCNSTAPAEDLDLGIIKSQPTPENAQARVDQYEILVNRFANEGKDFKANLTNEYGEEETNKILYFMEGHYSIGMLSTIFGSTSLPEMKLVYSESQVGKIQELSNKLDETIKSKSIEKPF